MMVEMSVSSPPVRGVAADAPLADAPVEVPVPGIGRVTAWLSKTVEVALAGVDLTLPQYRVLAVLADGSEAASGLAERLAVRPPSVTAVIDGLVTRGLVDRHQEDSDRRRVALRITDAGARIVAAADRAVDEQLCTIAGHLSTKDRSTALRSLDLWGRALASTREARKLREEADKAAAKATDKAAAKGGPQ
jgi:long-chain acyl-CoA synthetase